MLKKDFHHVLRNYFLIFFLLVFSPFALFAQHEQHGAATPTETSSKTTLSQSKPTGKKTEQQTAKKKPARAIKPLSLPRGPARTINLVVAYKTVYFAGKPRRAIAVNGQIPAPTLHFKEGEQVTINVYNHLDKETSIHWHGLLVPWQMDGVENVSQKAIPPGGVFHYRFTLYQRGTYWYHAHAKAQEQEGLYGAFLIDPPRPPAYQYSKDYVVVLSDWSNTPADNVFANLKKDGDYYSPRFPLQPSLMKFLHDYRKAPAKERKELIADYKMMQQMRMSIYDLSDIAYDAYLLNGQPKSSPWTAPVRVGDTVRLRFIGAGASTIYHVKIPDAKMEMVHSQGNDVRPYLIDDFWIAPGETYDVLVKIQKNRPYIIYAESIDTLGKVYGALVTNLKQPVDYQHIVPFPEPLPVTREMMANMMKSGMNHGSMAKNNNSMKNGQSTTMKQSMPSHSKTMSSQGNQHNMSAMTSQNSPGNTKHSNHSMSSMKQDQGMSGMNHASMLKNKMSTAPSSSMNESTSASRPMKPKGMPPMSSMSTGSMESQSATQTKHATMAGDGGMQDDTMNNGMSMDNGMTMPIEPTIIGDTISAPNSISAKTVGTKYQQLTAAVPTNNPDIPVDGIIRMELFGYMDRYIWMINGLPEYKAKPIVIEPGKRYRIIFTNNSMMRHPMHIHGHWFILRNGHGVYDPLLHTIEVDPGATAVADFDTEASGQWFFHCHHLFHMTSGMARVFQYETIIDVVNGKAKPETEIAPTPYINRPIVRVDEVMPIDKALITHPAGHHQGFYRANFLEVNEDPFHNAQEMTFRGYYGTDYQKLQLYTEDAEIYQGIVENADIDVFYWHLISQFWAVKGGVNYFYRPGGPYWQPGIGIEGLMPYYIDTNIRTYYRDGSVKFDIQLSRATQLTNNFFFLTGIRSILATHTVVENELGSGLNQMRYIIRPYYRVMPGLNVYTEFEYDKDYGAYKRILTDLGESATQTTLSFGVAVIF